MTPINTSTIYHIGHLNITIPKTTGQIRITGAGDAAIDIEPADLPAVVQVLAGQVIDQPSATRGLFDMTITRSKADTPPGPLPRPKCEPRGL